MTTKKPTIISTRFRVEDHFSTRLDGLYEIARESIKKMLKNRGKSSSKYYPELPCVVSKSLISKYQKNIKCISVKRLVIPICGDKGKQVKLEGEGVRIPALFKKAVLKVTLPRKIEGFIRHVEFSKRKGIWYCSMHYDTLCENLIKTDGCVGVDRNSVGNVAVFADSKTKVVRKLGICPARTKVVMRGRRKNLQKLGKTRLLKKLRLKQSRRMTHENHRASKSIVDYAATHCRAVVIEDLKGVNSKGSKIRRYSEKNNWAYAQLETFLRYKCALRGIPIFSVNPAFTSQDCSKCGKRNKPSGKSYECNCGLTTHRDVNAARNIAHRGVTCIGESSGIRNVVSLRCIDDAQNKGEIVSSLQTEKVGGV